MNVIVCVTLCVLAVISMIALIKRCGKVFFDDDSVGRWWWTLASLPMGLSGPTYILLHSLDIIPGRIDISTAISIFAIGIILGLLVW